MADSGQDVVDAAKNLAAGPIDAAQGAAAKAGDAISSAATTVGDAANSAVASIGDTVNKIGDKAATILEPGGKPAPAPAPTHEGAPGPEHGDFSDYTASQSPADYGIDQHFTNKMQEQSANAKKIGDIQNMPAAARAKYLADNGMTQQDIDGIQQNLGAELKAQQSKAEGAGEQADAAAKEKEEQASELAPVAKTLMTVAAVGMAPAVAAEGVTAAVGAGAEMTAGLVAGQIAKTYAMFKVAGLTGDAASAIVSRVFPNAGWKTKMATDLIGNLAGFAAGGRVLSEVPWLKTATTDMPEVQAAMDDNEHMMSDPVGIKHVEPEVMEGPAGASKTAKDVTPEAGSEEGAAKAGEGGEGAAKAPATPKGEAAPETPEETQVAGLKKAGLPVKLVSAQAQADRVMEKMGVPVGESVESAKTPADARQALVLHRGQVAEDIGIEENEDAVNQAINRKSTEPLTDEERTSYQDAHDTSIDNIIKLANAHVKAMARGDQAGVGAIGDLFTHESAKLNYLEKAMGDTAEGTGSVAETTAKTAVQSSDTLETIAKQQGTPAERTAKAEKIMGWQHYMDPANVAVSAVLYNPKLWLAKAAVDMAWSPYQNAIKGLSYVASAHPQDAISMWGASAKGFLDGVMDMWQYGSKSFTTGERVGEKELGMLNEPAKAGSTYSQDIDESHPGEAVQGLQSTFNPSAAAKLKNVAGMTLNTGARIILAEDQMAKTFVQRMALRTASTAKAITEANENGIGWLARSRYISARANDLMSLMPQEIFQKANDETLQLTFTSQNELASWLAKGLDKLKIPATAYSPEVHWGRLIGSLFLKTPFNMFKQGAMNTGLGMMMPESAGWGAGADFASRRLAVTRMAVGTGLLTALVMHAEGFHFTGDGPLDPTMAKQRQEMGVPDRSIGFTAMNGDQFYRSWEGLGPAATMLSLAANFAESYHSATDENRGDIVQHATTALSRIVDHGPLMHQMGHILEALNSASRGDSKEMVGHLEDAATMAIKPEVLSDIAKIVDPTVKDASTAMNRLLSENPFTRAGVPLKRDHFGYPQYVVPGHELSEVPPTKLETALYLFNPFHTTALKDPDPVEKECMRVGAKLKDAPEMFIGGAGQPGVLHDSESPKVGVPYSPDPVENARLRDRLQVLAGHEVLNSKGQNQHDAMLAKINTEQYQSATKFRQADMLTAIADTFLWKAQRALEKEDEVAHPGDGLKERTRARFQEQRQEYRGSKTASIGAP